MLVGRGNANRVIADTAVHEGLLLVSNDFVKDIASERQGKGVFSGGLVEAAVVHVDTKLILLLWNHNDQRNSKRLLPRG